MMGAEEEPIRPGRSQSNRPLSNRPPNDRYGSLVHDPEKHALGLDPMGGNRFSEKIMHQHEI
jgi:hypothetical protein